MKGESWNAGLEDANLSKIELCQKIQEPVPGFVSPEAPIVEGPGQESLPRVESEAPSDRIHAGGDCIEGFRN